MVAQARWLVLVLAALVLAGVALFQAAMHARQSALEEMGGPVRAEVPGLSAAERLAELEPPELAAARERGAGQWTRWNCASCHQPQVRTLRRQYPLEDLAAAHDIDSLAEFLRRPTPPMPAFPMDPEQRRDLAIWLLAREL